MADAVIAHNGLRFDFKWANREFIFHGLTPPSPYKPIDTLSIAKAKFNFNSNKLDDLGDYLGVGRKMKHEGFGLWKKCMAGDKRAFKKMVAYNKQDIILLESVYLKLRAWGSHPLLNFGIICPTCGSKNVIKRGFIRVVGGRKQRYQCECGRWLLSNKKEKVKNLDTEYLK